MTEVDPKVREYMSALGKRGAAALKAVVTTEQRRKWGRRGARKLWAARRKQKDEKTG